MVLAHLIVSSCRLCAILSLPTRSHFASSSESIAEGLRGARLSANASIVWGEANCPTAQDVSDQASDRPRILRRQEARQHTHSCIPAT